jgi:hypothetical protein
MKTNKIRYRKWFFVLLFTVLGANIFSQTSVYKPFPTIQARWDLEISGYWFDAIPQYYTFERYEANGDTLIGSYTYKKVMVSSAYYNCPYCSCCPSTPAYGPSAFKFAYRNDIPNKKVYIFNDFSGVYKDTLWYDFDLNVGDTVKTSYSTSYYSPDYDRRIITSIDSVLICGEYYKRFNNVCGGGFPDLGLIEGFGYEDDFIQTGNPYCPFEPIYFYNTDFSCSITSVKENGRTFDQIKLFPNPVHNEFQIDYPQDLNLPIQYSIVDCLGRIIVRGTVIGDKSINVSELESGSYFLLSTDKEGNTFQNKFLKQ